MFPRHLFQEGFQKSVEDISGLHMSFRFLPGHYPHIRKIGGFQHHLHFFYTREYVYQYQPNFLERLCLSKPQHYFSKLSGRLYPTLYHLLSGYTLLQDPILHRNRDVRDPVYFVIKVEFKSFSTEIVFKIIIKHTKRVGCPYTGIRRRIRAVYS